MKKQTLFIVMILLMLLNMPLTGMEIVDYVKENSGAQTTLLKYKLCIKSDCPELRIMYEIGLLHINGQPYDYLLESKQQRTVYWHNKAKILFDHSGIKLLTSQEKLELKLAVKIIGQKIKKKFGLYRFKDCFVKRLVALIKKRKDKRKISSEEKHKKSNLCIFKISASWYL